MKILFDATILASGVHKNSNRSGIFVAGFEIFSALARRPDVELGVYSSPTFVDPVNNFLAVNFPDRGYRVLNRGRSTCLGRLWERLVEMSPSLPLKVAKLLVKVAYVLWDKYLSGSAVVELAKGYDVFLSPVYLPPLALRRKSPIRRYTVLHDTIPLIFPQFSPFTMLGFSWCMDLVRNLGSDDYAFADSECTRRDYLRFASGLDGNKVTVVPLAADERFHPVLDAGLLASARRKYGIPQECKYVLSLCTIEPRKNLDLALRAFFDYLKRSGDGESVFVLGGGKWGRFEKRWESLLNEFGEYRKRIIHIGYVDDADIATVYSGATVFVYPSLYEGFGLPPLEAMQCGTPVVTSNTSSLPEVVGDAAITADPRDCAAFSLAMEQIISDERLRGEYSARGLARSRLFSWNKTAARIVESCSAGFQSDG